MKTADTIALAGAVLTCPHCHERIGVLRKTLYQGWSFGLDAIRFETKHIPTDGQAVCQECGSSYAEIDQHHTRKGTVITTLIHTEFGWLPKPPANVKPPPRKVIRKQIR